jgi:hypothetical protein
VWTQHDTTENAVPAIGFIAVGDGNLTVKMRKDTVVRIIPVVSGEYYPIDLKLVHTDSTSGNPVLVFGSGRAG